MCPAAQDLITVKPVQRRRHGDYNDPKQSRHQTTAAYTVPSGEGEVVQVCRATFQQIFDLVPKRVQLLVELKQTGNPMYTEERGNKTEHHKYSLEDENLVCEHVNSIPREQVFSLPTLTHSNMYYLRQLSAYNLGTHFHRGLSMMTLWHEGQSCRGALWRKDIVSLQQATGVSIKMVSYDQRSARVVFNGFTHAEFLKALQFSITRHLQSSKTYQSSLDADPLSTPLMRPNSYAATPSASSTFRGWTTPDSQATT
ncbi:hypothetical protein J6590_010242 [Homalodisca vitripennis]|nr:hypothetical protein J6590_010242 [Homalodisca vitripennis]